MLTDFIEYVDVLRTLLLLLLSGKWKELKSANEACYHLKHLAEDWEDLATQLLPDKHVSIINIIKADCHYHDEAQKALYKVLCEWMQCTRCDQRKWSTLCNAAKRYDDNSLEVYMEKHHLEGEFSCK